MTTFPSICGACGLPQGFKYSLTTPSIGICACKPYTPVMDRSYPDTAATEIQRLTDLLLSRELEIAALKRAAQGHALQALSDMAQADDALAKKDAEIARLQTGYDLYEVVRRMSVPQFRAALMLNLGTGKPFDEIVAGMAHEFGLTVRRAQAGPHD